METEALRPAIQSGRDVHEVDRTLTLARQFRSQINQVGFFIEIDRAENSFERQSHDAILLD